MKWLIANRGECASRIIRTAKKLGIETVAVFSPIDASLPFVKEAEQAIELPGNTVVESYMNKAFIVEVAKRNSVDMIHPGYGFLSEDPNFAKLVREQGIEFIGPGEEALSLLGNKREAKKLAHRLGVSVIPGVESTADSLEKVVEQAEQIGFPLMIKAVMGGGGMGIVKCSNTEEVITQWEKVGKLSSRLFHSSELILEKYIDHARHIEVQVIADKHGDIRTVGERECSIQRRQQKLVEEAPVVSVSPRCLERLREVSVELARAISFYGIGTVEFLVDEKESYYFMEMNPRLQVEHGVTELTSHIDLVEVQYAIAHEQQLSTVVNEQPVVGHAIQVRLYAEDTKTGYPSPGRVEACYLGSTEQRRLEYTYVAGMTVPPFYDPLFAKLIVYQGTREEAVNDMSKWLQELTVEGVKTNRDLLQKVMMHGDVQQNNVTTEWLQRL